MASSLAITETFTSIQGEGRLTGVPSWFVRFAGCNLRCAWCDTPYSSWSPEASPRSVDDLVIEARASGVRHAVITGGEPMLFPDVCALSNRLSQPRSTGGAGMHITIETAGTVVPTPHNLAVPLVCHLMSISPKLSNSTPHNDHRDPGNTWSARHESRRTNFPVLQQLLDHFPSPARQLKFVISNPQDLIETRALLAHLHGWTPDDILLMPEGIAPPSPDLVTFIISACATHGYQYCPRLHIELFGHARGT